MKHLSDNDGKSDKHWTPRTGLINWRSLRKYFCKNNYSGIFTLEVVPKYENENSEGFLKNAFEEAKTIPIRLLLISIKERDLKTLSIELLDFVALNGSEAKNILAAQLYKNEKLSLGQAATFAGLSKRAFVEFLD